MWANMVAGLRAAARAHQGADRRPARAPQHRGELRRRDADREAPRAARRSSRTPSTRWCARIPETGEKVLFVNAFTTHFTNFHTPSNVRFGQDYDARRQRSCCSYLISQALHPRVPGALALEAEQRGDLGQPLHPALRGDGLPAVPSQDGARRHRRRRCRTDTGLAPQPPQSTPKDTTMNFLDGSLFPENQDKLVITAAPYGPEWMPVGLPGRHPGHDGRAGPEGGRLLQRRRHRAAPARARARRQGLQAPVQVQRADRRRARRPCPT